MKKTHDFTGFTAYWIYVTVKNIHFGSRKYNIMEARLPRKQQFLNSWNEKRKDRDGMQFLKIMDNIPAQKANYVRLFAAYYMKKSTFHVSDILADNFQTYKANELELWDIVNTVKADYLTAILYCHERDVEPQHMFYGEGNSMPFIFKLFDRKKISTNSLIAFDMIFGIRHRLTDRPANIVDEDRIKGYQIIFDKYYPIVAEHFKDIAWKEKIQKYHHHIMKYGS